MPSFSVRTVDGCPDDPVGQFFTLFGNRRVVHSFFSFVLFVSFVVQLKRFMSQARR